MFATDTLEVTRTCPGSGVLRDWTSGKVQCSECGQWLWAQSLADQTWLGWTPPHPDPDCGHEECDMEPCCMPRRPMTTRQAPDYEAYRQRHRIEVADAASGDTVCAHDGIRVERPSRRWQHVPAAVHDARHAAGYSDGWPTPPRRATR